MEKNKSKKYFYSNNNKINGPFNFDELKDKNIKRSSLIWYEGLDDWLPATDVNELKEILNKIPPPLPSNDNEIKDVEKQIIQSNKADKNTKSSDSGGFYFPQNVHIVEEHEEPKEYLSNRQFFSKPFSFKGRVGRTEFVISFIMVVIFNTFLNALIAAEEVPIMGLAFIPSFWFLWAQGAKRCHDMGQTGWFQIIPFYVFWMIFNSGESETNEYGVSPNN